MPSSEPPAPTTSADAAGTLSAGRHLPSLLTFALTAIVVLVADLTSKSAAERLVPDRPHKLVHPKHYVKTDVVDSSGRVLVPSNRPDLIRQLDHGVEAIPHVLNLKLTANTGAVFGMGKGAQWIFTSVSVVAVGVIIHVFWRSRPGAFVLQACLGMILAGALGNLHDRLTINAVRDFLFLFPDATLPFGLRWPNGEPQLYPWIFNVADMALVVGVTVLLVIMWRGERARRTVSEGTPTPGVGKARN